MKKNIIFFSIFILMSLTFTALCEPTHGWWQKPIRLDWSHGGPNIKINETIGLTVNKVSSKKYKSFGYFTYNPYTKQIIEQKTIDFSGSDSVYIGEFEKDTRIGTWLQTKHGTFYSISDMNEDSQYRAHYLGDTSAGDMTIGLEGGKKWAGSDYREMIVSFSPTEHAPTGQPLPGIIISSIIGLGIAGLVKLKHRK